jgi:hypothetical protein
MATREELKAAGFTDEEIEREELQRAGFSGEEIQAHSTDLSMSKDLMAIDAPGQYGDPWIKKDPDQEEETLKRFWVFKRT